MSVTAGLPGRPSEVQHEERRHPSKEHAPHTRGFYHAESHDVDCVDAHASR